MKRTFVCMLMIFVAIAAWRIGSALSSDAISMAVGVLFGVLAGIPTALLVLASDRRRQEGRDGHFAQPAYGQSGGQLGYGHYPQQPPVIVVTGGTPAQLGQQPHYGQVNYAMTAQSNWPGQRPARSFRMVGEHEGMVD
jgi:hypothetical protein